MKDTKEVIPITKILADSKSKTESDVYITQQILMLVFPNLDSQAAKMAAEYAIKESSQ